MLRSSGSRARSKLAIVSASSSSAELSSSGRPANSDLRTSRRPAIARSMDDPKNAAAATSFASRVYSVQIKQSISGGFSPSASIWLQRSPRPHAHIADCFQPRMVPDRADVAVSIRRRSFAGRIDQPALINVIEVLRNALAQFLKNGLGAEVGAFVRRWILGEPPTEPVHSDLAGSTWVTFTLLFQMEGPQD